LAPLSAPVQLLAPAPVPLPLHASQSPSVRAIIYMCKCIVVTLLLAIFGLAANSASAAGFSSLEERMSQSEFHAAGLDKLSPAELNALNEWLRAHNATTTTLV